MATWLKGAIFDAMNGAQLHLAINHFPIVASFLTLLLLAWGWLSKSSELKKVALAFVILGAVFAGAAYLTGEPAEHILEKFPGFSKNLVHEHEEAAEFALIISCLSGLVAIAALYFSKSNQKIFRYAFFAVAALTLLSCAVFLRTAHLGGLIKHDEIRSAVGEIYSGESRKSGLTLQE